MEEGEEASEGCVLKGLGGEPKRLPQNKHVFKIASFFTLTSVAQLVGCHPQSERSLV